MKTVEEQIVVMQAYVDGKTILHSNAFEFDKDKSPRVFNWQDYEYDIVEDPIVKYMIVTGKDNVCGTYIDYESAKQKLKNLEELSAFYKIIKLVQDMDFKGDEK